MASPKKSLKDAQLVNFVDDAGHVPTDRLPSILPPPAPEKNGLRRQRQRQQQQQRRRQRPRQP
eukprot:3019463-Amphidinium_carterae.1